VSPEGPAEPAGQSHTTERASYKGIDGSAIVSGVSSQGHLSTRSKVSRWRRSMRRRLVAPQGVWLALASPYLRRLSMRRSRVRHWPVELWDWHAFAILRHSEAERPNRM
jgi:hypothetical protein